MTDRKDWRICRWSATICTLLNLACVSTTKHRGLESPEQRSGKADFQVLSPPIEKARVEDAGTTVTTPPGPIGTLAKPIFPVEALDAGVERFVVVVKVTIDNNGSVQSIDKSDKAPSSIGPFENAFRLAVDNAIRSWKFTPAFRSVERPGADVDGDGKSDYTIVERRDSINVSFDVRFEFVMVGGKPEVKGGI